MSGGIPYIDILIFAVIAIFLGLRLNSVLGKRTGFEDNSPRDQEMVTALSEKRPVDDSSIMNGSGIDALQKADPSFGEKDFIGGASAAYEMILGHFASGDMDSLRPLLSYEMNSSFSEAIRERQKAGEELSIELVKLETAQITGVQLVEGLATVSVEFKSQQKRMLKNDEGQLIDGDPETVETFIDRWSFERDVSSRDPNWLLVETESVQS